MLMHKDQIKQLSAEGRIKNSYEALYYNVQSGDPEADEILKAEIQRSFQRHDVVLADNPKSDRLRDVMLDAYKSSTRELSGEDLETMQEQKITKDFDIFTANHASFYDSAFKSFERRYEGEPVDFSAEYNRMVQEGDNPFEQEPTEDDLNRMEQEFNRESEQQAANNMSGLSYVGHVPEAQAQTTRRSYQQIKREEEAAAELKGSRYDREYDSYKRNRQDDYQKTTAGDEYGFDEHDYGDELEDDGPSL